MYKNIGLLFILGLMWACVPTSEKTKLAFRAPSAIAERGELLNYNSEVQMAPRSYVTSVLMDVFDAQATAAEAYILTDIYQKIEFGGACDLYAIDENRNVNERCTNSIDVVQKSTNNPMRYSLTTKVCEKLVSDTARLNSVRSKVFKNNVWQTPTETSVNAAWELFYPATPIDGQVSTGLLSLAKVTTSNEKAWQAIVLTLCMSPGWQTFN